MNSKKIFNENLTQAEIEGGYIDCEGLLDFLTYAGNMNYTDAQIEEVLGPCPNGFPKAPIEPKYSTRKQKKNKLRRTYFGRKR
jgi:hypothetical protein